MRRVAARPHTYCSGRPGAWRDEPLRWPAVSLVLLVVAPGLCLTLSFLTIADSTPANVAMAALSGAPSVALLVGGLQRGQAGVSTRGARLDLAAIDGHLHWCAVMAAWGLVSLVLRTEAAERLASSA